MRTFAVVLVEWRPNVWLLCATQKMRYLRWPIQYHPYWNIVGKYYLHEKNRSNSTTWPPCGAITLSGNRLLLHSRQTVRRLTVTAFFLSTTIWDDLVINIPLSWVMGQMTGNVLCHFWSTSWIVIGKASAIKEPATSGIVLSLDTLLLPLYRISYIHYILPGIAARMSIDELFPSSHFSRGLIVHWVGLDREWAESEKEHT